MRTKFNKRTIYRGTDAEDNINSVLSIVGGSVSCILSIMCVVMASMRGNILGIVLSSFIMFFMTTFYVLNCIYNWAAFTRVRRVFDILKESFALGVLLSSYMLITLCIVINSSPLSAWIVLGIEIILAVFISCYFSMGFKNYNFVSFIGKTIMVSPVLFLYNPIVSSFSVFVYILFVVVMCFYVLSFALQYKQNGNFRAHTLSIIFFIAATVVELFTILFFIF